jgi:hypothetical protein
MKKIFLVLLFLHFVTAVFAQRNSYFLSIAQDGQRYMFQNKQGELRPFIIVQTQTRTGTKWRLHYIEKVDAANYIIKTFMVTVCDFDDDFYPGLLSGLRIRHVTNDTWEISYTEKKVSPEYVKMIKAPDGFKDAYLDSST